MNLEDAPEFEENAFLIATDDNFPGTGDIWRRSFSAHDANAGGDGNDEDCFCLFAMDIAADGGYVIGGNNDNNGDDISITKFAPPRQQLMLGMTGSLGYTKFGGTFIPVIYTVGTSETWPNTDVPTGANIASRVVVPNGSTLTINSGTFNFAASDHLWDYTSASHGTTGTIGCGIVVEPGGKLIVNYATLGGINGTGTHNVWDGIVVHGTYASPSTDAYQGVVTLNHADINDARFGLYVGENYRIYHQEPMIYSGLSPSRNYGSRYDGTYSLGGGKISATYSDFLNCHYGANFENYFFYYNNSTFN